MGYDTVTVTDTATTIVSNNSKRIGLIIANSGSVTIYVGPDSSVTSSNGTPLLANGTLTEDSGGTKMFMGDVYGIASSGESSDVRYWERER